MQYISNYTSPLGDIILAGDDKGLTGLWFGKKNNCDAGHDKEYEKGKLPVFEQTAEWLDIYFSGNEPDFMPVLHMSGTPFQLSVWECLLQIPYGRTAAYKDIAGQIAKQRGIQRMSPQAVGQAAGHNMISIIVPCHRLVGSDGSLTGYAGGMDIKHKLLMLEKADMEKIYFPS